MLPDALQSLISLFETELPPTPDQPAPEDIDPWRERIDALDMAILHMLNERAVCANAIGHIKRQIGMPVYIPSREQEVLRNVLAANKGPLPNEAVLHLFERVIDETRSLERHLYQKDSETL